VLQQRDLQYYGGVEHDFQGPAATRVLQLPSPELPAKRGALHAKNHEGIARSSRKTTGVVQLLIRCYRCCVLRGRPLRPVRMLQLSNRKSSQQVLPLLD